MTLVRDTWLVFAYSVRRTLRAPVWIVIGLVQPVLWLLLFSPLLKRVAGSEDFPAGDALTLFAPGMLVMLALYSSAFVGFALVAELRAGVLERLAVTPAPRLGLMLGRVLRDVVVLVCQALVLLGVAALMGMRADAAGVAITLGLAVLIGVVMASCSYALALATRDENGLASVLNFVTLPLILLSGVMLPLTLAPGWIRALAKADPFSHVVEAGRALFLGSPGDDAVARAFAIMTVLAVLALLWAARSFRQVAA